MLRLIPAILLALSTMPVSGQSLDAFEAHSRLADNITAAIGSCDSGDSTLQKVKEHLDKALADDLWARPYANVPSPLEGKRIFDSDADAANELIKIVEDQLTCASLAETTFTSLFDLAEEMLDVAVAISGDECFSEDCLIDLVASDEQRREAYIEREAFNWRNALRRFGDAWDKAISAAGMRSKMTICHIQPGNPDNRRTITVSTRSLDAHFTNHGDYFGACSFEGTGSADLGLGASTDDPLAERGKPVKSKIQVKNEGPDDATNMVVAVDLPAGTYDIAAASGDSEFDLNLGTWRIPYIEANDVMELVLEGTATDELPTVSATMIESDQPDANPDNNATGVGGVDGTVASVSSSGGDGGLESNGSLAAKIAARQFGRAEDRRLGRTAPPLEPLKAASKRSGLELFVPAGFPGAASTVVTTPGDLVSVTNATDALSVDWISQAGSTLGAMMVFQTPAGSVYEHSKVICDRLIGARVERIRVVNIEGLSFVLVALRHEDGSMDYAVSFALYDEGRSWELESRFRNAEYAPPASGVPVVNLQVWSVSPAVTVNLVGHIAKALRQNRTVLQVGPVVRTPDVIARTAAYREGHVEMAIDNLSGVPSVTLAGTIRTAESEDPIPFSRTISVAPGLSSVSIPVGPAYDIGFAVDDLSGGALDEVYVSDGAWGAVADAGSAVETFLTQAAAESSPGQIDRAVQFSGSVRTWVAAFRFLRAGGKPADVSAFGSLRVDGTSSHPLRISLTYLNQAGQPVANHFSVDLRKGPARLDLSASGTEWLRRVTQLTFTVDGNGLTNEAVDLQLTSVAFVNNAGSPTSAEDGHVPLEDVRSAKPFPNPFVSVINIPVAFPPGSSVSASVFDLLGRRVLQLPSSRSDGEPLIIDGGQLSPGAYLVRLSDGRTSTTHSILRTR